MTNADEALQGYLEKLRPLADPNTGLDLLEESTFRQTVRVLVDLPVIDRTRLTEVLIRHPDLAPVLGLCVGLSQEQFKNWLRYTAGSSSWSKVVRKDAAALVKALDEQYQIVDRLQAQRDRKWYFEDVLVERMAWSRRRASRSQRTGRRLEDAVESVLKRLGLPYQMRTQFIGRNQQVAPCDFAIPAGGDKAQIIGSAKGFDSTGSKLSDGGSWSSMCQRPLTDFIPLLRSMNWRGTLRMLRDSVV